MLTFRFNGAGGQMIVEEVLTSGMIGKEVKLEFSEDWKDMTKTVVFTAGTVTRDVTGITNGIVQIPTEVLAVPTRRLYVGVYGTTADGKVLPTISAKGPVILPGTDPSGDEATDPTMPVWAQLQQQIEDFKNGDEPSVYVRAVNGQTPDEHGNVAMPRPNLLQTDPSAADYVEGRETFLAQAGGGHTQEAVVTPVSVGADAVTLDQSAPQQTVNLVWSVKDSKTIPAFDNYLIAKSAYVYPRTLNTAQWTTFFSTAIQGNADAYVQGHAYFTAMHYIMDGDSTATLQSWGSKMTPTGTDTISGSGWVYGLVTPTSATASNFVIKSTNTGTGTIDYLYCIDVTALQDAGVITANNVTELAELFGELPLIPGQNYSGDNVGGGTATLSINRGGEICTVDNTSGTVVVEGGDILRVEGGSVTFMLQVFKTVTTSSSGSWAGIKWVAFGDSLTDGSINADSKYHKRIAERTGVTVIDMGKGGTGYWRTNENGTAFYQRMANVPADADIITIFGSVNDWRTKNSNVAIGTASDTIEDGTLAGYINECINVAQAKAPYAHIALITPLDYYGIPDDIMKNIANIIVEVAKRRRIKCMDLYHDSGFRVDDPVFAAVYTTDYSETADTFGHPSNLAHEKIIAPAFMELLKRMVLTV